MATLSHSTQSAYTRNTQTGWLTTYRAFIEKAEFTRTGWSATAMMIQGCLLAPTLLLTMAYFGGGDWQFLTSMLCFFVVLIPILSAQGVKYIVPAFLFSFVVHLTMILINIL